MFSINQVNKSKNWSHFGQVSRPSLLINIEEKAAQDINGVREKARRFGVGLNYKDAAERFMNIYNNLKIN